MSAQRSHLQGLLMLSNIQAEGILSPIQILMSMYMQLIKNGLYTRVYSRVANGYHRGESIIKEAEE